MAIRTITVRVHVDTDARPGKIRDALVAQLKDRDSDLSKLLIPYGYIPAEQLGTAEFGEIRVGLPTPFDRSWLLAAIGKLRSARGD